MIFKKNDLPTGTWFREVIPGGGSWAFGPVPDLGRPGFFIRAASSEMIVVPRDFLENNMVGSRSVSRFSEQGDGKLEPTFFRTFAINPICTRHDMFAIVCRTWNTGVAFSHEAPLDNEVCQRSSFQ